MNNISDIEERFDKLPYEVQEALSEICDDAREQMYLKYPKPKIGFEKRGTQNSTIQDIKHRQEAMRFLGRWFSYTQHNEPVEQEKSYWLIHVNDSNFFHKVCLVCIGRKKVQISLKRHNTDGKIFLPIAIRNKPLIVLPLNIKWEDITMKFLDGEHVEISIKNVSQKHKIHCKEIGLQDQRTLKPNFQWTFLVTLAKHNGELSWDQDSATPNGRKKKQYLSKALKSFFSIQEDPFYSYKKCKSYKIKLNLIPLSNWRA